MGERLGTEGRGRESQEVGHLCCCKSNLFLTRELQAMKRDGFAQYELAKEQDMKMMDNERFGDPMSRAMAVSLSTPSTLKRDYNRRRKSSRRGQNLAQ